MKLKEASARPETHSPPTSPSQQIPPPCSRSLVQRARSERVQNILHPRHPLGKLQLHFAVVQTLTLLLEASADVADERLMWVHITKVSCEPAAIGIRIAQPASHLGSVETAREVLHQAVVFGCHKARGLVVNQGPWCVCPAVLLPHLLEDTSPVSCITKTRSCANGIVSWMSGIIISPRENTRDNF